MASTNWPPVVSVDTPLLIHICPWVGRGMMVIPENATDEQFEETQAWLAAVDWSITDTVVDINRDGDQVVELKAEPTGVLTIEASGGAEDQLLELAKLLDTPPEE